MSFEQFLVYQARVGEFDETKEMCDVRGPPVDINYRDDKISKNTALHMACANGHIKIVNLLLE
jgi:ankyrin repeat protein